MSIWAEFAAGLHHRMTTVEEHRRGEPRFWSNESLRTVIALAWEAVDRKRCLGRRHLHRQRMDRGVGRGRTLEDNHCSSVGIGCSLGLLGIRGGRSRRSSSRRRLRREDGNGI